MKIRKRFSQIIGLTQTTIGCIVVIFDFLLLYDFFNLQELFNLHLESIGLYLWIIALVGLLSTISGLFLFFER
jgi:hypothetical protein